MAPKLKSIVAVERTVKVLETAQELAHFSKHHMGKIIVRALKVYMRVIYSVHSKFLRAVTRGAAMPPWTVLGERGEIFDLHNSFLIDFRRRENTPVLATTTTKRPLTKVI